MSNLIPAGLKFSGKTAAVSAAAAILLLLIPIPSLFRFGIPAVLILLLAAARRGSFFYILALRASSNRDHERAERRFLKAAQAGLPVQQGCLTAVSLLKYGRQEEAGDLFSDLEQRRLKKRDPLLIRSYKALLLWDRGERDDAAIMLQELLNEDYRTTHIYSTLGYFLLHHGDDHLRALEFNTEAAEYDATPDILDNLAAAQILQERWEDAEETCERVIAAKPAFSEAWYHAGLVAEHAGDYDTAADRFRRALRSRFSPLTLLNRETVEKALERVSEPSDRDSGVTLPVE